MRARQLAVAELRPGVDLRETLALAGEDVRAAVDGEWLARWGAAAGVAPSVPLRLGVAATTTLAVASLAAVAFGTSPMVGAAALVLQVLVGGSLRARTRAVVAGIERPARDLHTLGPLLAVVERAAFDAPRLRVVSDALLVEGRTPSLCIAELRRLVDLLDARRNQLFLPIAVLLLWTTQLALAAEAWRARHGGAIGRWLAAVGELEALESLAALAFEHPDDPFPELVSEGPCFDGEGLGHPLLPADRVMRNDVRLGPGCRLLVVSGSNMSGKSTLLRTVGTNAVLAFAGGTVRAQRLALSPLALGASIRLTDSLLDGRSRFYAEILRLRAILGLAEAGPLLFLLDEVLHGTNSHDRRLGADAVVRALVRHGAVGLVTTHDLALAALADGLAPQAANVHFEDQLEGETLRFDYRMRPGVVTRSNALALMRAVGIEGV